MGDLGLFLVSEVRDEVVFLGNTVLFALIGIDGFCTGIFAFGEVMSGILEAVTGFMIFF